MFTRLLVVDRSCGGSINVAVVSDFLCGRRAALDARRGASPSESRSGSSGWLLNTNLDTTSTCYACMQDILGICSIAICLRASDLWGDSEYADGPRSCDCADWQLTRCNEAAYAHSLCQAGVAWRGYRPCEILQFSLIAVCYSDFLTSVTDVAVSSSRWRHRYCQTSISAAFVHSKRFRQQRDLQPWTICYTKSLTPSSTNTDSGLLMLVQCIRESIGVSRLTTG